ncbi:MAG: glycosyltransferase family 4 protein [Chloroflexi bacterium]|nr:MAG: glycosyltransferase family 4 protein [Chloroflexota bacterium]
MDARGPVGISLLTLVPGLVGGSETYARELLKALAARDRFAYRVFLPSLAPKAGAGLPATIVRGYRAGRTVPARLLAMSAAAIHPWPLRREMNLDGLRAIHFPLSVMLPPVGRPPAVSTVLDLQHEFLPGFFNPAELAYRRLVYGWTVRRSRIVITISEHARQTLIERLGLEPERVRAIHLGVDLEAFGPDPRVERAPFLLYPANRWPHKNHERLLAAFAILRRTRPELRLVLTGAFHEGRPVPEGVESLGLVSRERLLELYRTAAALVFPSLYEGFGQPPLEAMACGCPVAVSRTGPLPEIYGEAAAYFDPTSAEDIAETVDRLLAAPAPFVSLGLETAARYTWERCARRHEEVYAELLSL